MRRTFTVTFILAVSVTNSPAVDEPAARKQPVASLIKQLHDKDPVKVCAAAKALGTCGPAAKDAVPALKELLKDASGRVRWTAAEALWLLQHQASDVVPVFAELLLAADPHVRAASAWRLGRLGADARPAVVSLAGALRDENFEVRVQAGQALANLGVHAEAALPALVRVLGDKRLDEPASGERGWESVRTSPALPALLEMADASLPLLIATFREHDTGSPSDDTSEPRASGIASRVAHALPTFGARAVAPLLQVLESKVAEHRRYAAVALREMAELNGTLPESAITALEKCLDDSDEDVQTIAARVMAWVRPANAKAVKILDDAQGHFRIHKRELLADLGRMSPHNPAAIKLLLRMLEDDQAESTREAYSVLANLDLPADQVRGIWIKALAHADKGVRSKAIHALSKPGPAAKPALTALRAQLAREVDYYNRSSVLDLIARTDPDDPALLPLLIKSMEEDRDSWVRLQVITTLAGLGPKAKAAIPRIEANLFNTEKDRAADFMRDSFLRDLVDAIVRIAPDSADSVATLLKALRDRTIRSAHCPKNTWYMRDRLEDALQTYLPAAAPILRAALRDRDPGVRQSVALVLVRAGAEIETSLPVLMENLWNDEDSFNENDRFRDRALEVLLRRRTSATPVVAAALCKAWRTAGPKARAVLERGLLVLQPEALPHLLDQLRQATGPQARRDLAHLLARFEGQSEHVLPILREELRNPKFANQYAAMQALGALGPDAAEAVPELVPMLNNPQFGVRAAAASTLGSIGRAARPAVPGLKAMLQEARPEMRILAADALSRIDLDVSAALALLCDAFPDPAFRISRVVERVETPEDLRDHEIFLIRTAESIGRYGERAVLVLADLLDNTDLDEWSADNISAQCGSNKRIRAALLLAELGPEAKAAVPTLVRALKDKDPFVRDAAASALGRIGPAAREAVPDLIALLEKQNRSLSGAEPWSAAQSGAASRFGYSQQPFDFRSAGRGRLLVVEPFGYGYFNQDPYAGVRPAYPHNPAYLLGRIDTEARSALPLLGEIAKDPGHPGRLSAALAMWRSGGEAPDLIPAFTDALRSHARAVESKRTPLSPEMRECLAELDTQLKPSLRAMAEWLNHRWWHDDQDDRAAVAEAIGRLGTDARAGAALLRPLIHGTDRASTEQVAIAMALFRISGDKETVFPMLRDVLLEPKPRSWSYDRVDPASTTRVHAARALGVLAENGDERARALIIETAKGDENPHVRVAALEAMARLKHTNADAMAGLSAVLRHAGADVRVAAVSAFGRLGPQAKLGRPALKAAAEDDILAVRQAARRALEPLD